MRCNISLPSLFVCVRVCMCGVTDRSVGENAQSRTGGEEGPAVRCRALSGTFLTQSSREPPAPPSPSVRVWGDTHLWQRRSTLNAIAANPCPATRAGRAAEDAGQEAFTAHLRVHHGQGENGGYGGRHGSTGYVRPLCVCAVGFDCIFPRLSGNRRCATTHLSAVCAW